MMLKRAYRLTCFLSTSLSDTIDSVIRHREVGRTKDLSVTCRILWYESSEKLGLGSRRDIVSDLETYNEAALARFGLLLY
jgi:hypothetical protein